MKLLIDINLSPAWVQVFMEAGFEAVHWSLVGPADAPDQVLFAWARDRGCVVVTNDLDFGTLLAMTGSRGPSVVQIRGLRLAPRDSAHILVSALREHQEALLAGALLILQEANTRIRILPLSTGSA